MKPKVPIGVVAWRVFAPFLLAATGYAIDGLAFAALALVFGTIVSVLVARYDTVTPRLIKERRDPPAQRELVRTFQRLWLLASALGALGVVLTYLGAGSRMGAVVLVCALLVVVGGGVALIVMRWARRT